MPDVVTRSTLKQYRKSTAVTELKQFEGRGHSLTIDHGWRDVADAVLAWLTEQGCDVVDLGLTGSVAVVTGASKGIGLAISRALVAEGAHVVAGAREPSDELTALVDEGHADFVEVDLAVTRRPGRSGRGGDGPAPARRRAGQQRRSRGNPDRRLPRP